MYNCDYFCWLKCEMLQIELVMYDKCLKCEMLQIELVKYDKCFNAWLSTAVLYGLQQLVVEFTNNKLISKSYYFVYMIFIHSFDSLFYKLGITLSYISISTFGHIIHKLR